MVYAFAQSGELIAAATYWTPADMERARRLSADHAAERPRRPLTVLYFPPDTDLVAALERAGLNAIILGW